MARKQWHVFMIKGARGMLEAGVTNEPEKLYDVLYIEKCRDRTDALNRKTALERMGKKDKVALIQSAEPKPAEELPEKLYQVVNEGFVCGNCSAKVEPTQHDTPRNHCPFCLYSQHVDINPGDRKNPCRGLLKPIGVETSGRKGYVILYRCKKCGERTRAKAALKSTVQPDDFEKIIELSRRNRSP
jgi:predicted GIY-YIG superfamily endonuclease/DNA-directed RNA polymerase subunit RPC12/RpoP